MRAGSLKPPQAHTPNGAISPAGRKYDPPGALEPWQWSPHDVSGGGHRPPRRPSESTAIQFEDTADGEWRMAALFEGIPKPVKDPQIEMGAPAKPPGNPAFSDCRQAPSLDGPPTSTSSLCPVVLPSPVHIDFPVRSQPVLCQSFLTAWSEARTSGCRVCKRYTSQRVHIFTMVAHVRWMPVPASQDLRPFTDGRRSSASMLHPPGRSYSRAGRGIFLSLRVHSQIQGRVALDRTLVTVGGSDRAFFPQMSTPQLPPGIFGNMAMQPNLQNIHGRSPFGYDCMNSEMRVRGDIAACRLSGLNLRLDGRRPSEASLDRSVS
ncbi:hypothetical protein GSI_14292 [Ganoderma sinense ZZ0214-1]|uniref:Uncharacterized protein n=1 Tax=Ganoderma sinense ZZ0214-1 TaxID=1077348 RepID=A0A2G8RSP2_9APHY|nr:hypothetical protein GSI_14292 [Ganoderma sinense ZZ0214-1]